MDNITIPRGDKGFNIDFTVKDSSGTVYVLTDYTIKLKVWVIGKAGTLLLTGTVDIDIAADGTCHYSVVDGDFDAVGKYYAEVELTKTDIVESTVSFSITVTESG